MAGRTEGEKRGREGGRGRSAGNCATLRQAMHPLQINPRAAGRDDIFTTDLCDFLLPMHSTQFRHPLSLFRPFGSTRGSCLLRRAQIQISPRPHILKMSAPIYGSDETERFRLPRIQIVLFFDGFSSPENRVALRVFLPGGTNKHRGLAQRECRIEGGFCPKRGRYGRESE